MNFIPVDEYNRAAVLAFLSRHEHMCVQLVECVRLRKLDGIFTIQNNARAITGVLGTHHTVLHCLPDAHDEKKQSALKMRLAQFMCDKKISCVNGEAVASQLIIDILLEQGKQAAQVNEYMLMTLHSTALQNAQNALLHRASDNAAQENTDDLLQQKTVNEVFIAKAAGCGQTEKMHALINSPITQSSTSSLLSGRCLPIVAVPVPAGFAHVVLPDWYVVRCYENDTDALMELQMAYEKEEVTPVNRTTNAAVVRKNLDRLLQSEYVIALQNERGEFVAKANTNAIGIHYAQIGGVYTDEQYRGRHYASLLVEIILHRIIESKRRPVLYVRTTNEPAKKIYASLGFTKSLGYVIAYY